MRKLFVAVLIAAMTVNESAYAHAQLVASSPKAKSVVTIWPKTIWVDFDGNLINLGSQQVNQLVVKDSQGKLIPSGKSLISGSKFEISTPKTPKPGKITVSWRVVSGDGHPVSSSLMFYYFPKK